MKKSIIFTTIIASVFCVSVNAQDAAKPASGKPTFGVFAGVNFQNINGKDSLGNKLSNKLVPRYNVGVNVEIPIAPEFYIQTGLTFITKGAKGPIKYRGYDNTRETTLRYIELPINFLYKPVLGKGHFLLGFGPYFSYAVSGKAKFNGAAYSGEQEIQFKKNVTAAEANNNVVYFKSFDTGANIFFGYEFANGFNVTMNSQLGLVNIHSNYTNDANSKVVNMNTGFGINLGYRF